MKVTRLLILVVGLCATLVNTGFAKKKPPPLPPSEAVGAANSANTAGELIGALASVTTGTNNTAHGWVALFNNTTGDDNTANGSFALNQNVSAFTNTAMGAFALRNNDSSG